LTSIFTIAEGSSGASDYTKPRDLPLDKLLDFKTDQQCVTNTNKTASTQHQNCFTHGTPIALDVEEYINDLPGNQNAIHL